MANDYEHQNQKFSNLLQRHIYVTSIEIMFDFIQTMWLSLYIFSSRGLFFLSKIVSVSWPLRQYLNIFLREHSLLQISRFMWHWNFTNKSLLNETTNRLSNNTPFLFTVLPVLRLRYTGKPQLSMYVTPANLMRQIKKMINKKTIFIRKGSSQNYSVYIQNQYNSLENASYIEI